MAVAEVAVTSSRPTIRIAGVEAGALAGGLLRAVVRDDVLGLSSCELEIGNWGAGEDGQPGFQYFDRDLLEFGKTIAVSVGDGTLFEGRISAIEGRFPRSDAPAIVVLAEDRLQDMRMTRRTRTFSDLSDADVAAQIAAEHGLRSDVEIGGSKHRVLAQLHQSDLAFLRERARSLDAELWVTGATLHVRSRRARVAPPLTLSYGKELSEFEVIADLAHQRTSIAVTGWDVAGKRGIDERASAAVVAGELDGADSGPGVLRVAFGERRDGLAGAAPHSADEARARAEALMARSARRFVAGHGTAETQPGLRAGATVRLAGLGPLFQGDYYVAAVTHLFDGVLGLRTELWVERPGLGRAA